MKAALIVLTVDRLSGDCGRRGGFSPADRSAIDGWRARNRVDAFRPRVAELQADRTAGPQLNQAVDLLTGKIAESEVDSCRAAIVLTRSAAGALDIPGGALAARRSGPPAAPVHAASPSRTDPSRSGATLAAQIDSFGFDTRAGFGVGGFITTEIYPVVLMRDGAALRDVAGLSDPGGLAAHRAANPDKWTRWRRADGKVELLKKDGWKPLPFSRTYAKLPAGLRLDGLYRRLSGGGNLAVGGSQSVAAVSEYRFWPDGAVVRGGGAGASATTGDASVVARSVRPQERGRYRVDGLSLRIRWDDGSEEAPILVTDPGDPGGALWLDGRSYVRRRG
jgi:hypothetical protein